VNQNGQAEKERGGILKQKNTKQLHLWQLCATQMVKLTNTTIAKPTTTGPIQP